MCVEKFSFSLDHVLLRLSRVTVCAAYKYRCKVDFIVLKRCKDDGGLYHKARISYDLLDFKDWLVSQCSKYIIMLEPRDGLNSFTAMLYYSGVTNIYYLTPLLWFFKLERITYFLNTYFISLSATIVCNLS